MERKQNRWILSLIVAFSLISATQLFDYAGLRVSRPFANGVIFFTSVFGFLYLYTGLLTAARLIRPKPASGGTSRS
jgi:hypothetical protein